MNDWSPAEIETLKRMAAKGLTASKIAARIGRSRSAVCGKINRFKGTVRLANKPRGARGRVPAPKEAPGHRFPRPRVPAKPLAAAAATVAEPVEAPIVAPVVNLPATLPKTFLDAMMTDRCLHYVGDPMSESGPDMPVCGAERAQDAPIHNRYCARHRQIGHYRTVA